MQRTEHELETAKNDLHRQKSLDDAKIGELTIAVQGLTKDLQNLKSKHVSGEECASYVSDVYVRLMMDACACGLMTATFE